MSCQGCIGAGWSQRDKGTRDEVTRDEGRRTRDEDQRAWCRRLVLGAGGRALIVASPGGACHPVPAVAGRLRRSSLLAREGEPEEGAAAAGVGAVLERERAAVRFGDLAAEHQADARAAGLGGEERHEQVGGVRQPGPSSSTDDLDAGGRRRCRASSRRARRRRSPARRRRRCARRLMSSCSS